MAGPAVPPTTAIHHAVCPFTPQLSLVLINRPRRDGTLSWHWYTAATRRAGFEPTTSRSQVRHRTTRPPRTSERLGYCGQIQTTTPVKQTTDCFTESPETVST